MTASAKHHIGALDGFRGLAALLVVLFHYQADVFKSGSLGVDMFFVLSGFLITGLLAREASTNGRIDLPKFYARRALRLYPALLLAVVVLFLLMIKDGSTDGFLSPAAQALTYTTNLFVGTGGSPGPLNLTWSLGIEEQFYLLWPPLLALALARRFDLRCALFAYGALLAVQLATALALPHYAAYYLPTSRFPETLAGGALALALNRPALRAGITRAAVAPAAVLALGALVALCFLPEVEGLAFFGRSVLITAACLTVLAHAATRSGWVTEVLSSAPARWVGQRSYSLYLLHLFVLGQWVQYTDLRPALSLPVVLALALLAAHLSYVLVERPFLRFKPYARPRAAQPDRS